MTTVEKCGNCAFGVVEFLHSSSEIHCHRNSPIFLPDGDEYGRKTRWPKVNDNDFCGEWELTDTKS